MPEPITVAEVRQGVLDVLQGKFGIDPTTVTDSTRLLEDLDLDSIDFFDMTGVLEKRFDRDITFTEFLGVATFGDLMAVLEKVLDQPQG